MSNDTRDLLVSAAWLRRDSNIPRKKELLMPLTFTDQDLAELNNEIMGDMRGRELRLLANWLQAKINRQQQETLAAAKLADAPKPAEPPAAKTNGRATSAEDHINA